MTSHIDDFGVAVVHDVLSWITGQPTERDAAAAKRALCDEFEHLRAENEAQRVAIKGRDAEIRRVWAENDRLRAALSESVMLQSHYATLLNMHDGGRRRTFASADEWMRRLVALAKMPPPSPPEQEQE